MDGVTLTDAQVAQIAAGETYDDSGGVFQRDDHIARLAKEVQEYRAFRSVMAAAVRDVNAGMLKPYDALARIVAELATLDSRAVADGH